MSIEHNVIIKPERITTCMVLMDLLEVYILIVCTQVVDLSNMYFRVPLTVSCCASPLPVESFGFRKLLR